MELRVGAGVTLPDSMKPLFSPCRIYGLVIVIGLAVLLFFIRRGPSELEIITSRPGPQKSRLAFLGRWTQPVKQKLLPLREALFGRRRVVVVDATVFELNPGVPFLAFTVLSGQTNARGERVMVVRPDPNFREALIQESGARVISGPRITTAEDVQGQIGMMEKQPVGFATNVSMRDVGWWIDVETSVRRGSVALTTFFTGNEVVPANSALAAGHFNVGTVLRTNIALGARVTVPFGAGVILLSGATNRKGQIVGALLSPVVLPRQ